MNSGRLGIAIIAAVVAALLICGGAIAAAGNAAADGPFPSAPAQVLLKVDFDADPEATVLAPMTTVVIPVPGIAGINRASGSRRPSAVPRYTPMQPRSPPHSTPRFLR